MTPLRRSRLDIDRTLRACAFFSRALAGTLEDPEYADLLAQLGGLALLVGGPLAEDLALPQGEDLRVALVMCGEWRPRPCPVLELLAPLYAPWRPQALERWAVGLSVLGTPWVSEARQALELRFAGATTFLEALEQRGQRTLHHLERCTLSARNGQELFALAEVVHGALRALATHLDTTWPAPVLTSVGGGRLSPL